MKLTTYISGITEETIHIVCTDIAQSFSSAQLLNSNGNLPIACVVTAEGNDVRFAHGVIPISGAPGLITALGHLLYDRGSYLISNTRNIQNFQFINAVAGVNADLMATMFYEIGG
jgi:hypothetical protein